MMIQGRDLYWVGEWAPGTPVITAEKNEKWYELFVVHTLPDGVMAESLYFADMELDAAALHVSAYCDHAPNPLVVVATAYKRGWRVDPDALREMRFRWREMGYA